MLRLSFPCRQCQIPFSTRDERDVHLLTVHCDIGEESKGGDICERKAPPAGAAAANNPGRQHRCPDCSFSCGGADDLQVHRLTAHHRVAAPQQEPPPYGGAFSFDLVAAPRLHFSTGRFRGIQGENNSCYLDSSLMALFYAETVFDPLLALPGESTPSNSSSNNNNNMSNVQYARTYLTLHVVNQLRSRHFVPSALVVEWRRMIARWFGTPTATTGVNGNDFDSGACAHEEACEFIRFLVNTFGDASLRFVVAAQRPSADRAAVSSSNNNDGESMLQLLAPSSSASPATAGAIWTTEKLLRETLETERLSFHRLGTSLVLQLPRYGGKHRVLSAVIPSPCLYVTTDTTKARYDLSSLLVIGRSHFVSYMRIGRDPETSNDSSNSRPTVTWLYFDSMSAREEETNIPVIEDVSHQLQILEAPNASTLVQSRMQADGMEHLKRVVEDLSIAIYKCTVQEPSVSSTNAYGSKSLRGSWFSNRGIRVDPDGSLF